MDKKWGRVERNIYRRGGRLYISISSGPNRHKEAVGSNSILKARRLLKLREGQLSEGREDETKPVRLTFEDLMDGIFNDYRAQGRKSLQRQKTCVKHLKGFFSGKKAGWITTDRIKRYISSRLSEGASNASLNRERASLRRAFNVAVENGLMPKSKVPSFPKPLKENNIREGFVEAEELDILRRALPHHLRPLAVLGFETGMRRSEILFLTWEEHPEGSGVVDMRDRSIRLKASATKSGHSRTIFMTDELYRVLRERKDERDLSCPDLPWVNFFLYRGNWRRIKEFYKVWRKAAAHLDKPVLFHDLRRSAVRRMVRQGIPQRVAQEISGHKTASVFSRYNIVDESDLKNAALILSKRPHSARILGFEEEISEERD